MDIDPSGHNYNPQRNTNNNNYQNKKPWFNKNYTNNKYPNQTAPKRFFEGSGQSQQPKTQRINNINEDHFLGEN